MYYIYVYFTHTYIYIYIYMYIVIHIYNDIQYTCVRTAGAGAEAGAVLPAGSSGLCQPSGFMSVGSQHFIQLSDGKHLKRSGINLDVGCPRVIVFNCLTNQQPMFEFGLALLRCEPRVTESDRFLACQIIAWVTVLIAICPPTDN